MEDPIREGVRESIAVTQRAGIQIKMITGDYRRTAERIARNVGLEVADGQILEGSELADLGDDALQERVGSTAIFSRIKPQDKLRIVKALQAQGEIIAMIGDGVNDNEPLVGVVLGGLALAIGEVEVPTIRNILGISHMSLGQWGIIFGVALSLLAIVEFAKHIGRLRSNRAGLHRRLGDPRSASHGRG